MCGPRSGVSLLWKWDALPAPLANGRTLGVSRPRDLVPDTVSERSCGADQRYVASGWRWATRVSTGKQDLERQLDDLPAERIYVDKKKPGASTDRPGLSALRAGLLAGPGLGYARDGDMIVVHTLDRLGRTTRADPERDPRAGWARRRTRNLADPIRRLGYTSRTSACGR
jgi:hypothetical protein